MNKKKILVIIGMVVVIAIVVGIIVIINSKGEEINNNNVQNSNVKVTGKLAQYLAKLTDNYYIKYSGNFEDSSGNLVQSVVEYTKAGDKFALRSSEIDMYLIYDGKSLSSISSRYKMIVQMPKTSIDTNKYNLASDIGQTYVNTYKEKIGSTEYVVEEYLYKGTTLKYYFSAEDIKLIQYGSQQIRIIRLENATNTELLTIPTGYKNA